MRGSHLPLSKPIPEDKKSTHPEQQHEAKNEPDTNEYIRLALKYINGDGVKKNESKAIKFYEKAAELGNAVAQFQLAQIYYHGSYGMFRDYKLAASWYERAAKQGHASSANNLGYLYKKGMGVPKDEKIAFNWFQIAADKQQVTAEYNVGYFYLRGLGGVSQSYPDAKKWFQYAAGHGSASACQQLAHIYIDIEKNESKAIEYFSNAVALGSQEAKKELDQFIQDTQDQKLTGEELWKIANKYEKGEGIKRDFEKATEYYQKAAKKNHPDAQYQLGLAYENGDRSVPINEAYSFSWYEKAAHSKHIDAQYRLARCYQYGKGVTKDEKQAYDWYKVVADQDNELGQINLGLCLEEGVGVSRNESEAVKYFQKAARHGNKIAYLHLGKYFRNKKNFAESAKMYRWGNVDDASSLLQGLLEESEQGSVVNYHVAMFCDNEQEDRRLIEMWSKFPALIVGLFEKDIDQDAPGFIQAATCKIMKRIIPRFRDQQHPMVHRLKAILGIKEAIYSQLFDDLDPRYCSPEENFQIGTLIHEAKVLQEDSKEEFAHRYIKRSRQEIESLYNKAYKFLKAAALNGYDDAKRFLVYLACSQYPDSIRPDYAAFFTEKLTYPGTFVGFMDGLYDFMKKKNNSPQHALVPTPKNTGFFKWYEDKSPDAKSDETVIMHFIEQIKNKFKNVDAAVRSNKLWSLDNAINNISLDFKLDVAYLVNILKEVTEGMSKVDKKNRVILNEMKESIRIFLKPVALHRSI